MPHVRFTQNLARHVDCGDLEVDGGTVAECLGAYFAAHPNVRGYVLDDQGAVRHHVVVFAGGAPIRDRARLSDAVESGSEIVVMQALSGG